MGPLQNVDCDSQFNGDNGNLQPVVENYKQNLILFIWKDSYLCLSEHFVPQFMKEETSLPKDKEDEELAILEKPYVFWNSGEGICRIVPLSQLRAAFTACRPIHMHCIQLPFNTFDEMFGEIFVTQTTGSKESYYYVVGGLDSNSQGSNFIQWRIQEAWKQAQRAPQQQAQQLQQQQAQLAQQQVQQQQQQAQLAQQQAQQLQQPEQLTPRTRRTSKRKAAESAEKEISKQLQEESAEKEISKQLQEESKTKKRKITKLLSEIETNNQEQVKEYKNKQKKQKQQLDSIEESNDVASSILNEKSSG